MVLPFDAPAIIRSLRATLHGRGGTARPEAQPASLSRVACHERALRPPSVPACESSGGSAWESNTLRTLILKDLRHFLILPILRFLSFAAVNPQIAPAKMALDRVSD